MNIYIISLKKVMYEHSFLPSTIYVGKIIEIHIFSTSSRQEQQILSEERHLRIFLNPEVSELTLLHTVSAE